VFSPAKARGYLDIRIPSHCYYRSAKGYSYGLDFDKKVLVEMDARHGETKSTRFSGEVRPQEAETTQPALRLSFKATGMCLTAV